MAQIKKISNPKHKKTTTMTFIMKANLQKKIPGLPFIYSFYLLDSFIHNLSLSLSRTIKEVMVGELATAIHRNQVRFLGSQIFLFFFSFFFFNFFPLFVCLETQRKSMENPSFKIYELGCFNKEIIFLLCG